MSRTVVMNNKFVPSDFLPIGFLGKLPYAAIPAGWLVRDGTVYNIADYPELAAKLGSTYGGDGVTTFAVPDDRGLFERGLDLGKGVDAGRALGSYQDQDVQPHSHLIQGTSAAGGSVGMVPPTNSTLAGTFSSLNSIGTETRPKNRAYIPIIKAKNIYYDLTIQGGNAASLGGNPASYYAPNSLAVKYTDFTGSFAASGYRRLPDGTILQWGVSTTSASTQQTVTLPVAFATAGYTVVAQVSGSTTYYVNAQILSASSIGLDAWNGSGGRGAIPLAWICIGK